MQSKIRIERTALKITVSFNYISEIKLPFFKFLSSLSQVSHLFTNVCVFYCLLYLDVIRHSSFFVRQKIQKIFEVMSETQLKEYKKIFDDFDDKKRGFLSKRDTFDAVRCCGLNPSEDQLKQAVSGKSGVRVTQDQEFRVEKVSDQEISDHRDKNSV